MPKTVFDKYTIERRLAVGGMGEVFVAVQSRLDRVVILKRLLPEYAADAGCVRGFFAEARLAATLNHPNIVSIYEVGLWEGAYYIAMEYIDGLTLSQLLATTAARGIRIPAEVAASIVASVASALDFAHHSQALNGRGAIVHRDISPQNIMVRFDGVTKVVDFGIARATGAPSNTTTGSLKGKPAYMAPEQIRGEAASPLSDQYSLGTVFWELLCGRRLFHGAGPLEIAQRVASGDVQRPCAAVVGVPAQHEAVVMRMLQNDPLDRYPRCLDVATELNDSAQALGTAELARWMGRLGRGMSVETTHTPDSEFNFVERLSPLEESPESATEVPARSASSASRLDGMAYGPDFIWFEDEHAPLISLRIPDGFSVDELRAAGEAYVEWALNDVDRPFVLLIDGRSNDWLSSKKRRIWMDVENRVRPVESRYLAGQAIVLQSRALWTVLAAVNLLLPPTYPLRVFSNHASATAWLEKQVRDRILQFSETLEGIA